MGGAESLRVVLLCEDRRAENFLRKLCEKHGVRVEQVFVAPKGRGAASGWVQKQMPERVRQLRAKKDQVNLGLLVHVDGDDAGLDARLVGFADELRSAGLPALDSRERVAMLVPTWSIETWILHLSGLGRPPESVRLKGGARSEWSATVDALDAGERNILRKAVLAWSDLDPAPASLVAGRVEARKVGLG